MNLKSIFKIIVISSLISIPLMAYAATDFSGIGNLVNSFTTNVVRAVGQLFLTMAVVGFFYGVVEFIWNSREGKTEEMEKGKQFMMWGLASIFIMFSIWGIVLFAQQAIGLPATNTITIPSLNFTPGAGGNPNNTNVVGGNPNNTNVVGNPVVNNNAAAQRAAANCLANGGTAGSCQAVFDSVLNGSTGNPTNSSLKIKGQGCFASTECASGICNGASETCE